MSYLQVIDNVPIVRAANNAGSPYTPTPEQLVNSWWDCDSSVGGDVTIRLPLMTNFGHLDGMIVVFKHLASAANNMIIDANTVGTIQIDGANTLSTGAAGDAYFAIYDHTNTEWHLYQ